jgi:hypothetical protein
MLIVNLVPTCASCNGARTNWRLKNPLVSVYSKG